MPRGFPPRPVQVSSRKAAGDVAERVIRMLMHQQESVCDARQDDRGGTGDANRADLDHIADPPISAARSRSFDPVVFWSRTPARFAVHPLGRGIQFKDTPIASWAGSIARETRVPIAAIGVGTVLEGDALAALQRSTNDAFVGRVLRITLREPLLAFRYYGDLCVQVTQLYTSLDTIRQTGVFGPTARELLGLTGRNGADHLVAMRIEPGSEIAVGGISNRAAWADQILVEGSAGLTVVQTVTAQDLPFQGLPLYG